MRSKKLYLCFLIACLLVACVFVLPERNCEVGSMLLSEGDFPVGTIVNSDRSSVAEMPEESAGFTADYGGSAMYHVIGRYPTISIAENEFEKKRELYFVQTEYEGPWETPPEVHHVSSIFQKYHVACGEKLHGKYQCLMIGQYDEYYVFFFAYISDNGVTFDILNDLLQKIDARMEQCLQE